MCFVCSPISFSLKSKIFPYVWVIPEKEVNILIIFFSAACHYLPGASAGWMFGKGGCTWTETVTQSCILKMMIWNNVFTFQQSFFFYLPVFYLICVFPGQSGHLPSCTALLFSHSLRRSFPQLSKEQKPILIVQPFGETCLHHLLIHSQIRRFRTVSAESSFFLSEKHSLPLLKNMPTNNTVDKVKQ